MYLKEKKLLPEASYTPIKIFEKQKIQLEQILYEKRKEELKYENIGYNALFVTDIKNFYEEYHKLLEMYKDLSNVVTDIIN